MDGPGVFLSLLLHLRCLKEGEVLQEIRLSNHGDHVETFFFQTSSLFRLGCFLFSSWSFCSASRWSSGAFAVPLSGSPGTLPLLLHPSPLAHVSTPCRGASVLRFLSFVPLALTPWPSGLSFQRSLQPLTVGSWSSSVAYSPSWKAAEWWTVSLPVR